MTDLLTTVAIMFIVAGPFLIFANRFDLPSVPFLIIAGLVAGLFVDDTDLILELARYGIALLVFTFGVQISLSSVRTVLADSEIAALGQILVVGSLGIGFGVVLGIPVDDAVYLGVAVALSSTIVGTALLQTEIRRNLVRGRLAQSIQFVQDLVGIAILLVLGAGTLAADPIATQVGYGVTLLLVAVVINRYLFEKIGGLAGDSDELLIIGVVSLLVAFIGAAELAGISIIVGAFAAGLAVRHNPTEHLGLFNGITSIRDFFVAIFFVTLGMLVTSPTVEKLILVSGLLILVAVVKPVLTTGILIYQGYEPRSATLASLSSDQVSEFALIILIEAWLLGILTNQAVFDAIIFAAAASMITSSLSRRYAEDIYQVVSAFGLYKQGNKQIDERSEMPDSISDHIIIVGYGRQGPKLANACRRLDQPYVVIENDPEEQNDVRADNDAYVFGDAMEPYTWEKARVDSARLIISTVNSEPVSKQLIGFDFDADLILRSDDVEKATALLDSGALYVTVSDMLASEQLIKQLEALFDGELTREELREKQQAELSLD